MKKWSSYFAFVIALVAFAAWPPPAEAYNNFSGGCESCHGVFRGGTYTSNTSQDRVSWGTNLHNGHVAMVDNNCSACHVQTGDNPAIGGPSGDGFDSCVGCHGRVEDANTGPTGPNQIGAGLRQHHTVAGIPSCGGCHSDDNPNTFTPVGENVPAMRNAALGIDPCADAFYGVFGSDNDGDNLYDGNDPDCAVANQLPVAASDTYNTDEDTVLNVAAPGVLNNDTDVDGDSLNAFLSTNVSNGTLALNPDGSFSYTPDLNFFGTDIFTYVANDGMDDSNIASVTITVSPVNDPPMSDPNGPYIGTVGSNVSFDGSGSSDVDGTIVSYAWDFGDGNTGTGVSPTHTYAGPGLFTVTLTVTDDGGATDTAATTATIADVPNNPPAAVDDAYTTDEDTVLNVAAPGVLANDTDADGDPLNAILIANVNNGTLTLNPNGSFDYMPNADFFGMDTFTYVATDGMDDSSTATVTITVNTINDPPVSDPNGPYMGTASSQVSFDGSGSSDVDGTIASYAWDFGDGNTGTGVNPTNTYTGPGDFTVTLTVTDDGGATDTASTTATISDVPNTTPAADDDGYTTNEDTPLNVAAPGVLANDTDADGDTLNVILNTGVSNGALTLNPDGSFNYMPNVNFSGSDTFTYMANDGLANSNIATVTITVNPVNDQPMAVDNSFTTPQETTLIVAAPGVLENDSDPEGDPLTAKPVTSVANGTLALNAAGSFTYAPNAGFSGPDSFTYVANDGALDSNEATVTITVQAGANQPPVAADDTAETPEETPVTIDVLANDSDADGDLLTVVAVSAPANGTAVDNGDGTVTYTPNTNFTGTDSFTYTTQDGKGGSSTATVTVEVSPVNDSPVTSDDAFSAAVDTMLTVAAPGVLGNDIDPDGDMLTAYVISNVAHGILLLKEDGSFDYTPDPGFSGGDTFVYKANDGLVDSEEATVTITVQAIEVPVCDDGSLPVITEMEYNDEKLHIKGRATTGTTVTVLNADTEEILAEGIKVREGKWEAEIKGVGRNLKNVAVMTSDGCSVALKINDPQYRDDDERGDKPERRRGKNKK